MHRPRGWSALSLFFPSRCSLAVVTRASTGRARALLLRGAMFPDFRLMIAAVLTSVVALSGGFGVSPRSASTTSRSRACHRRPHRCNLFPTMSRDLRSYPAARLRPASRKLSRRSLKSQCARARATMAAKCPPPLRPLPLRKLSLLSPTRRRKPRRSRPIAGDDFDRGSSRRSPVARRRSEIRAGLNGWQ